MSTSHSVLLAGTMRCRDCSRAAGDIVGMPGAPLASARYIPLPATLPPFARGGSLRCASCGGRIFVDDITQLGRHVTLDEVGGPTLADALAGNARERQAA